MQTQILFKIDGFDVEVELDKNSEFCSALKIVDPDNWFVLEFQLRDVKVEEYAERVIWDHSRQQPRHVQIMEYDPFEQGFEYCEEEVKEFISEQPPEKWRQLEQ